MKKQQGSIEHQTYMMTEGGLEKSGYVDVKQPPKIKGRKLKSWKKRWVVLQQMSNMSEGTYAAKIDVFPDEVSSYKSPSDKFTLFLENVRAVQPAKSKKRAHAFEIVENEAVLLMAGETELESQTWVWTIRKIFWPNEYLDSEGDRFTVAIVENIHTERLSLKGVYLMTVTPEIIAIHSDNNNSYEWSLHTLKRFNMEKDSSDVTAEVLAIECGPKSECGEAIFQFRSNSILDILASIKKNIFLAISLRNEKKTAPCPPVKRTSQTENPFRHSVPSSGHGRNKSLSSSEQGIRDLLESPSKHAEKRFRLMSESSEASSKSEENMLDTKTEVTEEEQKTITNTTTNQNNISKFDSDLEPVENKSAKDILSEPIETKSNSANTESNYNRIDFKQPSDASHPAATIISTITVAKPGYQTSVLLDEKGYSHVNLNSVKVQSDGDKMRSLSNDSNQSAISCRSASSGSRDSGILNQVQEKQQNEPNTNTETSHRSTNSFDSAVSTTSVVENTESTVLDAKPSKLSVEIHEVEVTLSEKAVQNDTSGDGCIYQDVSFEEPKSECINKARSKLRKSNSTGYFQTEENPYEELDKYRKCKKDLVKHLGMDPKIDPSSVPPSLPDRPMSHKMKRKFGANSEKKIFTLPFAKHRSKKNREKAMSSTSSESDSENGSIKRRDDLSCIKVWPLGDMSIADNNEFYQPVAIERFLNDKDANSLEIKRERSCSLNLNRVSDIKRPSVSSVNVDLRVSSRVKHGRNASLNADLTHDSDLNASDIHHKLFQQKNSSKPDAKKTDANSPVSQVQFSLSPTSSLDNEMTVDEDSDDNETEPIYAEVLPVGPKRQEIEEPFPDLDEWKPQNMSDFQTNELDDTNFENDGEVVVDLFNIGFVTKNEPNEIAETKVPNTGILIDLFDTETSNEVNRPRTKSAVDIFNATNSALMENSGQSAVKAENIKADLNQAFIDIFSLGAATPMQQSSTEFWSQPTNHESSSVGGSLANTNENWADFSQFEAAQRESTTTTSDSIYMDMSNYKNESIYVMPSEAREQH